MTLVMHYRPFENARFTSCVKWIAPTAQNVTADPSLVTCLDCRDEINVVAHFVRQAAGGMPASPPGSYENA